jgi:hypothetical protein
VKRLDCGRFSALSRRNAAKTDAFARTEHTQAFANSRSKANRHPFTLPFSIFHSPPSFRYSFPMFDIVKPLIATAADKTNHLRRFL